MELGLDPFEQDLFKRVIREMDVVFLENLRKDQEQKGKQYGRDAPKPSTGASGKRPSRRPRPRRR